MWAFSEWCLKSNNAENLWDILNYYLSCMDEWACTINFSLKQIVKLGKQRRKRGKEWKSNYFPMWFYNDSEDKLVKWLEANYDPKAK